MSSLKLSRRDLLARASIGITVLTGVGALAACGGGAPVGTISTTTAQTSISGVRATTPTTSARQSPVLGERAVSFWQWGSGYVPGFTTLVQAFNTSSQHVKVVTANPSNYWNKIVTTQASGEGPDVFLMNNVNFKQWAHNNSIADLSSYLSTDRQAAGEMREMATALVDWYHYQGKLMGTPWDYSAGIVGVNVSLLEQAGLTAPNDLGKKWDWHVLRDYATKLTRKSGSEITRSGIWINAGLENGYYSFCVANGGSFFNTALDQCIIASPEAIAGLDFVLTMIKYGIAATNQFKSAAQKAHPGPGAVFIDGVTAMDFEGDWMFKAWEKGKSLRWDAAIFPYSPMTGKTANTSNLRGMVMNAQSKQKDATWSWMAYTMGKAVQDQIPTLFGEIPANRSSASANYLDPAKGGPPPGRTYFKPDLDATVPLPASEWISWNDIVTYAYGKSIQQAFALQLSAADALKQIEQAVNGIIAANRHS